MTTLITPTNAPADGAAKEQSAAPAPLGAHIRSLDGLRGLSISMVLLGHGTNLETYSRPVSAGLGMAGNGSSGVFIFFVISGFLITTLLLREERKTGQISLKHFYLRRAFRILPAYYTFIGVVAILGALGRVDVTRSELFHALTFTWLFVKNGHWTLAHTWSLSVEEQFYLIWPVVLVLLPRKWTLRCGLAIILASPLARWWVPYGGPRLPHLLCCVIDQSHFDTLMMGSLPAILWSSARFQQALTAMMRARLQLIAVGVALVYCAPVVSEHLGPTLYAFEPTIRGLGAFALVFWAVRLPDGLLGRLLNLRPLKALGLISFSVYLWQQIFVRHASPYLVTSNSLINVMLAIGVGCCSYYLIEQPFLRLRVRLLSDAVPAVPAL